jgi:hypothetical protein
VEEEEWRQMRNEEKEREGEKEIIYTVSVFVRLFSWYFTVPSVMVNYG